MQSGRGDEGDLRRTGAADDPAESVRGRDRGAAECGCRRRPHGSPRPFDQTVARLQPVRVGRRHPDADEARRTSSPSIRRLRSRPACRASCVIDALIDEAGPCGQCPGHPVDSAARRARPLTPSASGSSVAQRRQRPSRAGGDDCHGELRCCSNLKKTLMRKNLLALVTAAMAVATLGAQQPPAQPPAQPPPAQPSAATPPPAAAGQRSRPDAAAGLQRRHQPGARRRHGARSQRRARHQPDEGRLRRPRGRHPADHRHASSSIEANGEAPEDDTSLPIRSPQHAAVEAARDDIRVFVIFWDEYHIGQMAPAIRAREALVELRAVRLRSDRPRRADGSADADRRHPLHARSPRARRAGPQAQRAAGRLPARRAAPSKRRRCTGRATSRCCARR